VTAGPVSEDPKKRAAVFRLSNAVLGSRRGVFFTRSIAGRGVVRLRPGLRWLEFTPRRWWRGRARKWQGSSLLPRSSRRHVSKRRSRREIVPNRLRHKQPLSQLNQSIHSLIPSPISHIDQVSKIRDCIVESGIAQLLEQAALQLDRDLLQGDNGDGVAALEGFAEALDAALLLALDVGGRLVDGLFEQARGWSGAFLRALELDFLNDGAAVTVGGDDGCYAGLGGEERLAGRESGYMRPSFWDGI
jgi:hypothetical protein